METDSKESSSNLSPQINAKKYNAPAQIALENKINILRKEILGLKARQDADLLSYDQTMELKNKRLELKEAEKSLANKKSSQIRSAKFREKRKKDLEKICEENPEI